MIQVGKKHTLDRCPVSDGKVGGIVQELSLLFDEDNYLCRDLSIIFFVIIPPLPPFALYRRPRPAVDKALDMVCRHFL